MRPVMQLINGGGYECPPEERGDCFRACVASILELDPETLPNPHDAQHWGNAWNDVLAEIGIRPLWLEEWQGNWFAGYWIASIPSRNIEGRHCVVMRGPEFVHDPSNGKRVERVDLEEVGEAVVLLPLDPSGSVRSQHRVQGDVHNFFEALDLPIGETPAIRNPQINADLILEEARETAEAITGRPVYIEFGDGEPEREQSLAGAIDGLCDQLATIYGAAITFGVDLAPFWDEVHRTNMAKAGGPKREDGKQLKPPGWQPPDIAGLLAELYPEAVA